MKIFLDFFPILLFFAAYKLHDWFGVGKDEAIYFATPVLMGATVLQMSIIYAMDKKLTTMHKVTLALNKGWELHGSPTYAYNAEAKVMQCGQAVVKDVPGKEYTPDIKLSEQ